MVLEVRWRHCVAPAGKSVGVFAESVQRQETSYLEHGQRASPLARQLCNIRRKRYCASYHKIKFNLPLKLSTYLQLCGT